MIDSREGRLSIARAPIVKTIGAGAPRARQLFGQRERGAVSHTESGSTFNSDRMIENGTYSAANARPTDEDTQYHDFERTTSFSQSEDTSPGSVTAATTNVSSTYHGDGNHTLTSTGTTDGGGYTLDVSTTLTSSASSSANYHDDVIGDGTRRQSQSASETTDHYEIGTYTNTNGTQTASGTVHERIPPAGPWPITRPTARCPAAARTGPQLPTPAPAAIKRKMGRSPKRAA